MAYQINDPINANVVGDRPQGDIGLVSHVMELVKGSRDSRNTNYQAKWDAYERTYRGIWATSDKTREGERSKLIAPAITQAVDATAATIVDAIFSRQQWIDVVDDYEDQQTEDVDKARKNLMEDLELTNVPDSISKCILNGCIYGTGIGKLNLIKKTIPMVTDTGPAGPSVRMTERPLVTLDPIPPWEYVIDSQARDQASALFEAHETHVPRNVVWRKQAQGIYRKTANVLGFNSSSLPFPAGEPSVDQNRTHAHYDGSVWVTEYYGLVPASKVRPYINVPQDRVQGNGMVEVIVTIANESELLRVQLNPFKWQDRPMIVYQHSYVPGKFWGEGLPGKAWNAQRALDAELRARMDALGLITAPMMGADITRLPRNPDMRVRPGKVWLTRGRPSEVLEPIILGDLNAATFNQSSEMERLVQVATGSIESNAPLNVDRRNETASGISMIQSSALKRMRLTMRNIERQFLNPLIRKSLWRLMQFNPERYPGDYNFCIKGTMGIVAREFEQASLTALLSVIPPESPIHSQLVIGIIEMSGSPKRDELLATMKAAMQPNPVQEELQRIQLESAREALNEQRLENEKTKAEIAHVQAQTRAILVEAALEPHRAANESAQTRIKADSNRIQDKKVEVDRIKASKPTGGSSNK